jgi:hypothetical protein
VLQLILPFSQLPSEWPEEGQIMAESWLFAKNPASRVVKVVARVSTDEVVDKLRDTAGQGQGPKRKAFIQSLG